MDAQVLLVLIIISVALVLFATERFPADVIALGIVITLVLTGLLSTSEAFAGFGSDTVIMILGLLIMTAALVRTGVVELTEQILFRITGSSPKRILAMTLLAGSGLSSFMSNTAATAFLLPMIIGIAHRVKISVAKLLLPLAFGTILASSLTLVATSTNLVVSGMMTQYGMPPLSIFELTPVGLPILVAGIVYMYFIGDRLIPDRTPVGEQKAAAKRLYLTEMVIGADSEFVGKTLGETNFGSDFEIQVVRIVRDRHRYLAPHADLRLEANDELLVECARSDIMRVKFIPGIELKGDGTFSDPQIPAEDIGIFEIILLPGSSFIGRTLRGLHARDRYDIQVLAVNRHGEPIDRKLNSIRLQLGDVLMIQGYRSNVEVLEEEGLFSILDVAVENERPDLRRAPIAVMIFLLALILPALNIIPLSIAALTGAVLVFVTRCITPEEAYRQVEWRVLMLIGSMLALGVVMETTGTAAFLAQQLVNLFGTAPPVVLLTAFFILTVVLTQPLSNQAAAVVVLPVAVRAALQLDFDPRTFAVMIAVAASCGFLTPLEPACVMVYGPGRYRFMDFVKVGALLTILIYIIAIVLIPVFWPPV